MEHKKIMDLNIQLFAEGENENTEPKADITPKTFDEMLKSENYQSEFDKRVAKSLETAKTKWQSEYDAKLEAERTEAQKLAKMDAEQKLTYSKEQAEKERDKYKAEINAYKLKDQALQIAKENNMDVSLLGLIDFNNETAETVKTKLDFIKTSFDKAVETSMNNKLKQDTPKQYNNEGGKVDPYIQGFEDAFK